MIRVEIVCKIEGCPHRDQISHYCKKSYIIINAQGVCGELIDFSQEHVKEKVIIEEDNEDE